MANNKKFIIGSSIALLVLFGAAMGTGAIIGVTTKDDHSYIKMTMGGNEIVLSEESGFTIGDEDATDEVKAKLVEEQFYAASLFGTFNASVTEEVNSNYILNEDSSEWNAPFVVENGTDKTDLAKDFALVKFINETETSSVYTYLNTLQDTASNPEQYANAKILLVQEAENASTPLNWADLTGLQLIANKTVFVETIPAIQNALISNSSYLADVYGDMFTYSYMWQDAQQKAYDYIFTRELVYASPSIVSTMELNKEGLLSLWAVDDSKFIELAAVKKSDPKVTATEWNDLFTYFDGEGIIEDTTTIDDQVIINPTDPTKKIEGFKGYQGISFGTSAGSLVKSDWMDWDNTWVSNYEDGRPNGITTMGDYSNSSVITNGNYYVSSRAYAPGTGAIIHDEIGDGGVGEVSGTAYVYAYSQLYPYVFNDSGSRTYSLFAGGDATDGFTNGDSTDNYIFDTWFTEDYSLFGEIYVTQALIDNKSALTTNAQKYWNNEGFYIELSGSYEEDLASYLPESILLNE